MAAVAPAAAAAPVVAAAAAPTPAQSGLFGFDLAAPAFTAPNAVEGGDETVGLAAAQTAMTDDPAYAAAINAIRERLNERLIGGAGAAPVVAIIARARGEGGSTIALSLAQAIAASGKRALLVDCDHRRPTLSAFARRLRKVIIDQPGQVASILTRDASSGGEALILPLGGPGGRALSARLHERFDWILLDCGPLTGVGALLAFEKTADAAVIVDAAGTDAAALAAAAERDKIGALAVGVVRTPARTPRATA